jgi:hypothetical protein
LDTLSAFTAAGLRVGWLLLLLLLLLVLLVLLLLLLLLLQDKVGSRTVEGRKLRRGVLKGSVIAFVTAGGRDDCEGFVLGSRLFIVGRER